MLQTEAVLGTYPPFFSLVGGIVLSWNVEYKKKNNNEIYRFFFFWWGEESLCCGKLNIRQTTMKDDGAGK